MKKSKHIRSLMKPIKTDITMTDSSFATPERSVLYEMNNQEVMILVKKILLMEKILIEGSPEMYELLIASDTDIIEYLVDQTGWTADIRALISVYIKSIRKAGLALK